MTTDREAAAGLVKRLEAWAPVIASGYECPAAGQPILEAAATITTLLSELERVEKERDEAVSWNWAMAENVKIAEARATKAQALVAEAVNVCEPFAKVAENYTENSNPDENIEIGLTLGECRAARIFLDRAKDPTNGK